MQLAIGTTFDYQVPVEQQLIELEDTVFTAISLGANTVHSGYLHRQGQRKLLALSEKHRLEIDSLHVPFTRGYDLSHADSESRMAAVCRVALCLAAAVELTCPTAIVHLNHFSPKGYQQNVDSLLYSLDVLIESAENMKINIAAENLYDSISLEFLERALAEFKSERFGFCYDSSHDLLSGNEPYRILEKYADRLLAVHLSDNDGREDCHWISFTGQVDWERICSILKESGYSGSLLLEVENREEKETAQFLQEASDAALRLRGMING
ncbi:MAG: sugar phosphate isomerase/epimerase [candidate division Zixibacteria bacterium]|nr:sugar phosphate isomerase/epimerase [candidate division Zixibacteria bacterium]